MLQAFCEILGVALSHPGLCKARLWCTTLCFASTNIIVCLLKRLSSNFLRNFSEHFSAIPM